jgi:hypothetical protein
VNRPGSGISTLGHLVAEFASADEEWIGAAFHPTEPSLYAEVDTDLIGISPSTPTN